MTTSASTYSIIEKFNHERRVMAGIQSRITTLFNCDIDPTGQLRMLVDALHADCPQYEGYWDEWILVRARRNTTTKAGLAFNIGDVTLGRWDDARGRWELYSIRNGMNTIVDAAGAQSLL